MANTKKNASRLLTEKKFWSIIEESLDGTNSIGLTWKRQYKTTTELLSHLSDKELLGFYYQEIKLSFRAYRQELWAVAFTVMGDCSDDSFMDFRDWLVYRGKEVFKQALRDHESLVPEFDKIPDGDIPLYEQYPVLDVFDKRHGEGACYEAREQYEFYVPSVKELEIKFQWGGDGEDSLRNLCPSTFKTYWENTRF